MTNADWMVFHLKLGEYHRVLMTADWLELRDLLDETMPSADPALRIELSFTIRHLRNLVGWYAACVEQIVEETADPGARRTALAELAMDDVRPACLSDDVEERLQKTRRRVWEDLVAPLRAPGGPDARN